MNKTAITKEEWNKLTDKEKNNRIICFKNIVHTFPGPTVETLERIAIDLQVPIPTSWTGILETTPLFEGFEFPEFPEY